MDAASGAANRGSISLGDASKPTDAPIIYQSLTRPNSTKMSPVQDSIAPTNALKSGRTFMYTKPAQIYGIDRSTLACRHQGFQVPREVNEINQQQLTPQQEPELLQHVDIIDERLSSQTRTTIQSFASIVKKNRPRLR